MIFFFSFECVTGDQVLYLSQVTALFAGMAALCEEPLRLNGTEARGTDPMRIRRCRGLQPYERSRMLFHGEKSEYAIRNNTNENAKQDS